MDDATRRRLADYIDGRVSLVDFTADAVRGKKKGDEDWSKIFNYIFKYQNGEYTQETLDSRLNGFLLRNRKK